jgi:formiminotetrahydrofolate cyclodeaminase
MDLSKTLHEYFNELSSNSPTPGGGNVAALCGALSASLGTMVCNLTIGKRKYADVETLLMDTKAKLHIYKKVFLELAEKDNEAFNKVMDAFSLPKETEADKELRLSKIQESTLGAIEIPTEVMKTCDEILPLIKAVIEKGNTNSLSDAGVAASLIETAAKSAYLNVLINCSSLSNQTIANEIKKRADIQIDEISKSSEILVNQVIKTIQSK